MARQDYFEYDDEPYPGDWEGGEYAQGYEAEPEYEDEYPEDAYPDEYLPAGYLPARYPPAGYPPEGGYPDSSQAPWLVFPFPSPGCITGFTLVVGLLLALFLINLIGAPPPAAGPAAAVQVPAEAPEPALEPARADGATFVASPEAAAAPCQVSDLFPKKVLRWCNLISYYANNQSLNPDLVAALIWLESGGNEVAYSRSGAVGLMQVMPKDGLAATFMCINGPCFGDRPSINELQNPEFNIKYGTKMLARLLSKHGDLREALKSYGPMNVGYYYADKVLGLFNQYGKAQ